MSSASDDTNGMIMMPMTRPGGERALRGDVEPERSRHSRAARADGERREEAVDDRRNAREDLEQRLGPGAERADARIRRGRSPRTGRSAPRRASRCRRSAACPRTAAPRRTRPTSRPGRRGSPSAGSTSGRTGNRAAKPARRSATPRTNTDSEDADRREDRDERAAISSHSIARSTRLRARNSGRTRR